MHPAYSLIVFTVVSGAGFGLLTVLGLAALVGMPPAGGVYWAGFILGFGLTGGGLLSSTLHLGHPERAWRAFSQWRTSWLSREGVLAVLTLGVAVVFALGLLLDWPGGAVLGALTAILSLTTVFATSMIYAQLRTVRRWHRPLTVVVFMAFSLAAGLLLFVLLLAVFAGGAAVLQTLTAVALFAAWSLKLRSWSTGDRLVPLSTPETATGLGGLGRVRMFEAPHTGENYLLKEMGFHVARKHRDKLRMVAFGLGGVLPVLAILVAGAGVLPVVFLGVATLAFLAGLVTERWLFFAEAEHSVMTYYSRG